MKKNARVDCVNGQTFWTTQKEFWRWVRQGLVVLTGDRPLTGRFRGQREHLLVMVGHTILDLAAPNHRGEVLAARRYQKRHLPKQPVLKA